MQKQSGERSGRVKNEGLKSGHTSDNSEGPNIKKSSSVRGGDNGQLSDEDFDENEIQQAGGNNNGGIVPGAFGRDSKADGHRSLKEGM
jgi:hypothetical protein